LSKPPKNNQNPRGRPLPPHAVPDNSDRSVEHEHRGEKRRWLEGFAVLFAALAFGAASYQGWVTRDSEKRQLRAYVGVIPGDIENFGVPGKEESIIIRKNYGQTPAYDVGFAVNFIRVDKKEINVGLVANCVNPKIGGMITMFPTAELPFNVVVSEARSPALIAAVHKGELVITTYGNSLLP